MQALRCWQKPLLPFCQRLGRHKSGTGSIDFAYIGRILPFLLGMYLLSSAFHSFIQGWLMTGLSQKVRYDFRRQISEKIKLPAVGVLRKAHRGRGVSRITNDVDTLGQSLN